MQVDSGRAFVRSARLRKEARRPGTRWVHPAFTDAGSLAIRASRVHQCSTTSRPLVRPVHRQYGQERPIENADVQPQGPALDVIDIEPDHIVEAELAAPTHLPQTGHTARRP